jgi:hypothetical protein
MKDNVLILLPAKARQIVYVAYGIIALVCASTQVGYNAIDLANPAWLVVSSAVIAFLAVPIGALAALNVTASPSSES